MPIQLIQSAGQGVAKLPEPTLAVVYLHTDALGSPVAETDESGGVLKRTRYEPYGAPTDGLYVNGPGFTGHVTDAATGLTYMQQRYYDPLAGRFLSLDPVGVDGGSGGNFNRDWYANNNPYRFTDPDGRRACPTGSHICFEAPSTKSGPKQPAISERQEQKNSQVAKIQRTGRLGDGTRITPSTKEEQSFSVSPSGSKAGIDEKHTCMRCDGKRTHVMSFSLPEGDSPGHTHGEGVEQRPGRDDASRTSATGQTAYVITKTAAFGVDSTPDGYRVMFISGTPPDPAGVRAIESRIETWNSFKGTGGSACSPGC